VKEGRETVGQSIRAVNGRSGAYIDRDVHAPAARTHPVTRHCLPQLPSTNAQTPLVRFVTVQLL